MGNWLRGAADRREVQRKRKKKWIKLRKTKQRIS